jgi:hypothetical protein
MHPLDQDSWQDLTSWNDEGPSAYEALSILERVTEEPFKEALLAEASKREILRAGHAQRLEAEFPSASAAALRDQMKADLGYRPSEPMLYKLLEAEPVRGAWNNRFANLVSGRFTELLFERAYRPILEKVGLHLDDATKSRNFVDYVISGPTFELSVNVKNAGVQYQMAADHVGLEPEDTIPMATYKAFGALKAATTPLLYVFLVDWQLLPRLRRSYWEALDGAEKDAFRLFASYKSFGRRLEDAFIEATVGSRLNELRKRIGYMRFPHNRFRSVSAARCAALFYEQKQRSPYVYERRMNTDPNVHLSVKGETTPFRQVISERLSDRVARRDLLKGLRATKGIAIPDPPL